MASCRASLLPGVQARGVAGGDVGHHHAGAVGSAGAGVVLAGAAHAGGVAAGVEAGDGLAEGVEGAAELVDLDAALGALVAEDDLRGVEGVSHSCAEAAAGIAATASPAWAASKPPKTSGSLSRNLSSQRKRADLFTPFSSHQAFTAMPLSTSALARTRHISTESSTFIADLPDRKTTGPGIIPRGASGLNALIYYQTRLCGTRGPTWCVISLPRSSASFPSRLDLAVAAGQLWGGSLFSITQAQPGGTTHPPQA